MKLSEKTKIFRKLFFVCEIAWKNLNVSEIFLENRNFLTRGHDPQISNQIDAAVWTNDHKLSQKLNVTYKTAVTKATVKWKGIDLGSSAIHASV